MKSSFEFRGLRCFPPATDAGPWNFLPTEPDLQRGTDGKPMLTMVDVGASAHLLFTATWGATSDDLERLRAELAMRSDMPNADQIRLAYAPVESPRCNVLIGRGGFFETAATSATSGFPPYDAVFSLSLEDERLFRAKSGLRGEHGFLGIEYAGDVRLPVNAKATFSARAQDLSRRLQSHGADAAGFLHALEQAVESGIARVVIEAPEPHANRLAADLYARVLARAAQMVPRLLRQDATADLEVTVTLEQEVSVPTRAFSDVGALVSAGAARFLIGGQTC